MVPHKLLLPGAVTKLWNQTSRPRIPVLVAFGHLLGFGTLLSYLENMCIKSKYTFRCSISCPSLAPWPNAQLGDQGQRNNAPESLHSFLAELGGHHFEHCGQEGGREGGLTCGYLPALKACDGALEATFSFCLLHRRSLLEFRLLERVITDLKQ